MDQQVGVVALKVEIFLVIDDLSESVERWDQPIQLRLNALS